MLLRILKDPQFLLGVGELIDHQGLNVAKTIDDFLLQLRCLDFRDHFLHVAILSFQILLFQREILSLYLLKALLLERL